MLRYYCNYLSYCSHTTTPKDSSQRTRTYYYSWSRHQHTPKYRSVDRSPLATTALITPPSATTPPTPPPKPRLLFYARQSTLSPPSTKHAQHDFNKKDEKQLKKLGSRRSKKIRRDVVAPFLVLHPPPLPNQPMYTTRHYGRGQQQTP